MESLIGTHDDESGFEGVMRTQPCVCRYRMHADIMTWSSEELYGGGVTAHPSVAGHTLAELKVRSSSTYLRTSILGRPDLCDLCRFQ